MCSANSKQHYIDLVERLAQARVLCVGDVMLDRFIYGRVHRISPEAPIPVLRCEDAQHMLGGAGNVVRNATSLGASAGLIALLGEDNVADDIRHLLCHEVAAQDLCVQEAGRRSTLKTRYIAESQQLLRADDEDSSQADASTYAAIMERCRTHLAAYDVLILSDYDKGTLSPAMIGAFITMAREHNVPICVDPKQWDVSLYEGATLLSPNEAEMVALNHGAFADERAMFDTAAHWCRAYDIAYILITRGAKGMVLCNAQGVVTQISTQARDVFDVSGAGDTVIATLACALAVGASMQDAAYVANHAAGIVVGRLGTATLHRTDLKAAIHTAHLTLGHNKVLAQEAARQQVLAWKQQGLRVGFTNGCFDIVHAGHVSSIGHCKSLCDRLILALNSDASVRRLKGETRPVNAEMDRAMLLAALSDVDMVVIFREDTPEALLHTLQPDVLMKGEDYALQDIVGRDIVEAYGGQVARIPLVKGYSTTATIDKIQQHTG